MLPSPSSSTPLEHAGGGAPKRLVRAAGAGAGSAEVVVVAGGSVTMVCRGRVDGAGELTASGSTGMVLEVDVAEAARKGNSKGTRSEGIGAGDSNAAGRSGSGVSGGSKRRKKMKGAAPAVNSAKR